MSPYKTQNYFVKQTSSAHPIRFHYSIFSHYDIIIFPSPRFRVDGGGGLWGYVLIISMTYFLFCKSKPSISTYAHNFLQIASYLAKLQNNCLPNTKQQLAKELYINIHIHRALVDINVYSSFLSRSVPRTQKKIRLQWSCNIYMLTN